MARETNITHCVYCVPHDMWVISIWNSSDMKWNEVNRCRCMYGVRERVLHHNTHTHNKRNINRNEKLRILSQAIVWMDFFSSTSLYLRLYDFIWVEWISVYCCKPRMPYDLCLMPCIINHLAMNHICKMREYINNHHHRWCRSISVVRCSCFGIFIFR